jgi:hypothetical protein
MPIESATQIEHNIAELYAVLFEHPHNITSQRIELLRKYGVKLPI